MNQHELEKAIVAFVQKLCERHSLEVASIEPETELFRTGILDSVRFVQLMNYLMADLEIEVPDRMLDTSYFQTPALIAKNFATPSAT